MPVSPHVASISLFFVLSMATNEKQGVPSVLRHYNAPFPVDIKVTATLSDKLFWFMQVFD